MLRCGGFNLWCFVFVITAPVILAACTNNFAGKSSFTEKPKNSVVAPDNLTFKTGAKLCR